MASMANERKEQKEQKGAGEIRLHLAGMDPLTFTLDYQEGEKGGSVLMTAQNELTKDKYRSVITENSLRRIGINRKCRLVMKMLLIALQSQKPDEFTLTVGYLDRHNMPGDEAEQVPPNRAALRAIGNGLPLTVIVHRETELDEETLWFVMDPVEQDKADRLEAMVRDRQRELAQAHEVIAALQAKVNEMEAKMQGLTERSSAPVMGVWTSTDAARNSSVKWNSNVLMLDGDRKDFLEVSADGSRFTSPAGGVYQIDVSISCQSSNTNGGDFLQLRVGGGVVSTRYSCATIAGHYTQFQLRDVVRLTNGQYFEIHYQNAYTHMSSVSSGAQAHRLIVTKLSN